MRALISIHDVMPETLPQVERLVSGLREHGHRAVTLLVVPGRDWDRAGLDTLAGWQREGLELAAHGWHHEARTIRGPFHLLHAAVMSRRSAEHLALEPDAIAALMRRAGEWFAEQGLDPPDSYVPPAWALGRIGRPALRRLPYRQVEVTRGLIDLRSGRLWPLPLVGFQADTALRERFLRGWNRRQRRRAQRRRVPLRIGIHPGDLGLRLAGDLRALLAENWQSLRYDAYAAERREDAGSRAASAQEKQQ